MHKILLIYFEPQTSGQTTHVHSLCKGLDRKKFAITVILPENLKLSITVIQKTGVDVVPLPMKKIFWSIRAIISLWSLIQTQKFDIVHVVGQEAGLLTRLVAYFAGAEIIIYTPQCTNIRRENVFWLYRIIEKILSYITDMIISVNENDRMRIIQWGIPSSKVVTVPNGIDLDSFNNNINSTQIKRTLGFDEKRPLVMQVGRLSHQKNPLAFVEGATLVIQEHPEAQFAMVGDGPLKDRVEKYINELGMKQHIVRLGWKEKAFKIIGAADIVSLTSNWEGSPYTLLEAMAWSRPIVSTAVNGCNEIVKHEITGYLVPTGDVVSWANYVIKMLANPNKSFKMGKLGRELLEEEYSLQKMIDQIQGLYEKLVYQNPKRMG
jgi:glycosyltransferase involved in cell wall biosynthesis